MSDETNTPRHVGRPRKNGQEGSVRQGALYTMLNKKLTTFHVKDRLNVRKLAAAIGMSYQALYRTLGSDRLSPECAKSLIHVSRGALREQDVLKFVLG